MTRKTMSRLLKAFLLIAAALAALFFFAFLPFYGSELARCSPEFRWAYWPCQIWAWFFAVPIFAAVFPAWEIFGSIEKSGEAFSRKNAKAFRLLSILAFSDAAIFPLGMLTVAFMGAGSAPLTVLVTPVVIFIAAAVGTACYVMSRLVSDAAALKDENDLTI